MDLPGTRFPVKPKKKGAPTQLVRSLSRDRLAATAIHRASGVLVLIMGTRVEEEADAAGAVEEVLVARQCCGLARGAGL